MRPLRVLVIDDEIVICQACRMILIEEGCLVQEQATGEDGLQALANGIFDVVLLDLKLPDMDGMDILKKLHQQKPDVPVIVMTGYSTVSIAVEAMKSGAADYLSKPFTDEELIEVVERAQQRKH
jgi:DNA-binding NtrC family response regulator